MNLRPLGALRPVTKSLASRAAACAVLAATAVTGPALAGSTMSAPASAAPLRSSTAAAAYPMMAPSTYEARVQYWINHVRKRHGLPVLRRARCTDRVAERWDRYLAVNNEFYHQSMQDLLERCNAYYSGETLARGPVRPRRLVRLWMHSPEHRAVLMNQRARRIGIGSRPDAYGRWVTAADFMHF